MIRVDRVVECFLAICVYEAGRGSKDERLFCGTIRATNRSGNGGRRFGAPSENIRSGFERACSELGRSAEVARSCVSSRMHDGVPGRRTVEIPVNGPVNFDLGVHRAACDGEGGTGRKEKDTGTVLEGPREPVAESSTRFQEQGGERSAKEKGE